MKMKVVYADGTEVDTVIGPRAQVEVEERYGVLFTEIFDERTGKGRLTRFYFAAWAALHASGHKSVSGDVQDDDAFKAWLSGVVDVEPVAEPGKEPTSGRTRKAAPRGKSSSSAS